MTALDVEDARQRGRSLALVVLGLAVVVLVGFATAAIVVFSHAADDIATTKASTSHLVREIDDALEAGAAAAEKTEGQACVRDRVLLSIVDVILAAIVDDPAALGDARTALRAARQSLADLNRSARECRPLEVVDTAGP